MQIIPSFLQWFSNNINTYTALLFDVDGTLIMGRKALPGVSELLALLNERKFPYMLLTNDGNHSHTEKLQYLASAGLDIRDEQLISTGDALKLIVEDKNLTGEKFFAMGDLGKPDYAEAASLKVVRDFKLIKSCKGVIIGEANYNWEPVFNAVINFFIQNPQALLIVPNPDTYWPHPQEGICIGAGGKARFICSVLEEYGIQINPIYLGKPYSCIFNYTHSILCDIHHIKNNLKKEAILMLGDSLASDIAGANRAGYTSGLVMTGITSLNQIDQNRETEKKPDYIFQRI